MNRCLVMCLPLHITKLLTGEVFPAIRYTVIVQVPVGRHDNACNIQYLQLTQDLRNKTSCG